MKVIFQSTDKGATKVFDKDGQILEFNRQNNNLIKNASGDLVRTSETDDWICVLEDEDLIKRARAHPNFKKDFWEVDKVPTKDKKATVVKTFEPEKTNAVLEREAAEAEAKAKAKEEKKR